jgi:hypothetical protein
MMVAKLLSKRLPMKPTLIFTVCAACFAALDPMALFADGSKSLPLVRVSQRPVPSKSGLSAARNRFPLYFVENRGQVDPRAAYYIQGADKVLYFGSTSAVTEAAEGNNLAPSRSTLRPKVNERLKNGALFDFSRQFSKIWERLVNCRIT